MQVLSGDAPVPPELRGGAIAIGNFDGVHRGHQALIAAARQAARGKPAGAMVFDPHPQRFFQPERTQAVVTPSALKFDLMARYGLTFVDVQRFDAALAGQSAEQFIVERLVKRSAISHVVVGWDFRFGKGRAGSPDTLRAAGAEHGFSVTVVEPVTLADGAVISSTAVRAALAAGQVDQAARLLGHWWRVEGVVTGGAKRGTGLGFPTANITLDPAIRLGHGIYAARVYVDAKPHAGAAYLGTRPTFDNGAAVLETFLLDFEGDLYGKSIQVEFIAHLRGDQAFADGAALAAQMTADVARTRHTLSALEALDPYRWPLSRP
jgi:riboflavin kinase/FMN adenylyltransferase